MRRPVFDLLPQPAHVNGDRARVDRRVVAPDALCISWSREKTRRGCDARKQSRSNSFAVSRTSRPPFVTSRVSASIVTSENRNRCSVCVGARRRSTVRTRAASARAAKTASSRSRRRRPPARSGRPPLPGGEHDHGHLGERAQPAANREPVEAGQHQIQHDQVGRSAAASAHADSPSPASSVR